MNNKMENIFHKKIKYLKKMRKIKYRDRFLKEVKLQIKFKVLIKYKIIYKIKKTNICLIHSVLACNMLTKINWNKKIIYNSGN